MLEDGAVKYFEHRHIVTVLDSLEGSRKLVAHDLGISPATLFRHIESMRLAGYRFGTEPNG